ITSWDSVIQIVMCRRISIKVDSHVIGHEDPHLARILLSCCPCDPAGVGDHLGPFLRSSRRC
ncbi:unnamed protein product, partial [Musa acuminata subsp. burmannicoides]